MRHDRSNVSTKPVPSCQMKWENNSVQPRPQGLLGIQNGDSEKPWQTAGDVSPKLLEILVVSNWQRAL